MTWASGEIITASRLIDVPTNKLIGGDVISYFNLLKIYNTNIFTETLTGTGDVVESLANGTIQVTCPATSDQADTLETNKIALSLLPRISIIKINSLTNAGSTATMIVGLVNVFSGHKVGLAVNESGVDGIWRFVTYAATSTRTVITSPVAGDVFIIYATSSRCSLFKNSAHVATHTTTIPTNQLGRGVQLLNGVAGASEITLGFMS